MACRESFSRVHFAMSPAIRARIDRMVQDVQQRHTVRAAPLQLAPVWSTVRTDRQLHVVAGQPGQQAADAASPTKLLEHQTHDRLYLLVRIDDEPLGGDPHVTDGCVIEDFATPGLVPQPLLHAALEDVQFRFAHCSLQAQK